MGMLGVGMSCGSGEHWEHWEALGAGMSCHGNTGKRRDRECQGSPLTSSCSRSSQAPSSPSSRSCAEPRARSGRNSPLRIRPRGRDRLDPAGIPTAGEVTSPGPMNFPKKSGIAALQSHPPPPLAPLYPDTCGFSSSCSPFSMSFSIFSFLCYSMYFLCYFPYFLYFSLYFSHFLCCFPCFLYFPHFLCHFSYFLYVPYFPCHFLSYFPHLPYFLWGFPGGFPHYSRLPLPKVIPYPFWVTSNLIPRELRSLRSPRCPRSSRSRNRARNSGEGGRESMTTPQEHSSPSDTPATPPVPRIYQDNPCF